LRFDAQIARPLPGMPEVSAPPFARNGCITFGSFNRYSKNSPMVLEVCSSGNDTCRV